VRRSRKQGLFLRIEEFSRRRYRLVFLATLLLCVASILLGRRLSLDADVMNLVPRHNPVIRTFREALADFGSIDYLLLLVEARDGQGPEDLQEFADVLAARVAALPTVSYVEYKIDTSSKFFSFFRTHQILFLPPDRLPELRAKFTDAAIRERVRDNLRQLTGPSSIFSKRLLEEDPFLISPLLFEEALRSKGPLKVDLASGYYLARDGSALLIIAKPVKPAQDTAFDKNLIAQVRGAEAEAAREFAAERREAVGVEAEDSGSRRSGDAGEVAAAPLVRLGGGYIIADADSTLIKKDMVNIGLWSFGIILALYYFCYRRFGAVLYSSVPLLVGQILTLAIAYIFLRNLNSATTGFSAMLMGLGTDFTIVMYARYVEERARGASLADALRLMMGASALGVFTGAITSAGTFYSMCITEYKGLRDFGFLVGTGILLCLVAILFLLPAMIAWHEGRAGRKGITKRLYLHSFGIERVMTWSTRRPWPVLLGSILLTIVGGTYAWNISFTDDVRKLRSETNEGVQMEKVVAEKFGAAFSPMMVVCSGGDLETVMQRNRDANRILDGFVEDHVLLGYESIFSYVPPRQEQERVIASLGNGSRDALDTRRIERTFRAALRANGFREGIYDDYLKALPAALRPEQPVTVEDLNAAGLDRFVSRYIRKTDDGSWKSVTYLFRPPSASKRAPIGLVAAFDGKDGIALTSVNIASAELKTIFKRDAWRAVILGLLIVTVLLWLDFRSLWLTTLANIQLLTGVVWMLGAMTLLNIEMNFVNAFVTTMILGVGIDYGIHIIHRISQEGLSNPTGLLETGKAVVMAALTNVAGFGTVWVCSNYPGLASMGLVAAIGSFTCLVTSLTTLPALLILTKTRVAPRRD
jgi:hypothetical protein